MVRLLLQSRIEPLTGVSPPLRMNGLLLVIVRVIGQGAGGAINIS